MINVEKDQSNSVEQEEHVASPEQNSVDLKAAVEHCHAEIALWQDQCKRISAEFENFKKRSEREQMRWAELAKEKLLKDVINLADDFERALKQTTADSSGLQMMYQSLLKFLQRNGVVKMESYDYFNPEFHEAVMQVESPDHTSEQIVEVFAQGFMLHDKVLRPAQVSVAK